MEAMAWPVSRITNMVTVTACRTPLLWSWTFVLVSRIDCVLSRRSLLAREGVTVDEVTCRHAAGRGRSVEEATDHAFVLKYQLSFTRTP
jgi:hypothetical protein